MLSLHITPENTTIVKWKRETRRHECEGEIEITGNGQVIRATNVIREKMPEGWDPETEERAQRAGGCCGGSAANE